MFIRILSIFFKSLLPFHLFFLLVMLVSLVLAVFAKETNLFLVIMAIEVTYFLGGGLPYIIHEWFHVLLLNKFSIAFKINCNFLKFSIIPSGKMSGRQQVLVAIAGPMGAFFLGILLRKAGKILNSDFLGFLSYFYIMHIIFLLPFFGDGRVIVINTIKCLRRNFKC